MGPVDFGEAAVAFLAALPGVFYVIDRRRRLLAWSESLEQLSGYEPRELAGVDILSLLATEEREAARERISHAFEHGAADLEARLRSREGSERALFFSGARIRVRGEEYVAGVGLDISERMTREERLRSLTITDDLTGLLNRRGFFERASEAFELAKERGTSATLVYADLDSLKDINDFHGHGAGDQAIVEVARALRETFRESDVLGRLGGDEFAALVTDANEAVDAAVVRRFRDRLRRDRTGTGTSPPLSTSVGVAGCSPCDTVSVDDLLTEADARMYAEKARKPGGARSSRPPASRTPAAAAAPSAPARQDET